MHQNILKKVIYITLVWIIDNLCGEPVAETIEPGWEYYRYRFLGFEFAEEYDAQHDSHSVWFLRYGLTAWDEYVW